MAIPSKAPRALGQASIALLGLVVGLGLGYLAIRGVDWGGVAEALRSVPVSAVAAAVAVVLASARVRAWRWRVTFAHVPVATFRLFQVENAALGVNNLSPVRMGGEVVSLAILALRDKVAVGAVLATIIMTRALDLTFTLLFIGVGILSARELTDLARPVAFVSVFAFAMLIGLLNLRFIVRRVPMLARLPGVASFEEAISELWADRPRLAVTFGLTATYWLALAPAGFLLGQSMGIELSLFQFMLVVLGAVFFATATPGLPGAVGAFEFAVIQLLRLWDVPQDTALAYAIVLHLILFLPPIVIAGVVLPREGVGSLAALRERRRRLAEQRVEEAAA